MNGSPFSKNLELWSRQDPKQSVLLQFREPCYQFCQAENGLPNLKKQVEGTWVYYHSKKDPAEEAKNWFQELDLKNVPVLYIYGVGLGYYYDAAKAWLKKNSKRRLVFLEDDLDVLHALFQTDRGTELLLDRQVQLLYFADLNDNEAVFEVLYWNFAMTRILVSALYFYEKTHSEFYAQLKHKIAYDSAVKNALVDEYLRYGGAFFINFYKNMLSLPGSYLGNKTFGSFRKVPAIICGAGPSLAKNLPLLSKVLDKALVFAGGSALNALNAAGIQPHLGAGIDPNPAQFDRLSSNRAFEVPFYYRNRMYHDAFEKISGPRLYITGCGGYDVSDYFEERLGIKQEFLDEGHNVINFCLQIAHQLGCNPIIFIGLDLAFTGMQMYAPGVEENVHFDPKNYLELDDFDAKPLLLKDIYGKPLYTLWKWVAEADWIGDFSKEHPELTILNATEGGLGFPGVPNISFNDAVEQYLNRSYPIRDRLHGEIQNSAMPSVTFRKISRLMKELKESLKRCVEKFDILLEEIDTSRLQSGRAALAETDLEEEEGFQYVLEIFNQIQARLYNRDLQEAKEKTKAHRKKEINKKRFAFLREVAKVNIGLIDLAFENKKPKKKTPLELKPDLSLPICEKTQLPTIPLKPMEGQRLPSGHIVTILRQYGKPPEEIRLEKEGVLDGQCLLYYPDGKMKAEFFYRKGLLEGSSTYFSPTGQVLAKSCYHQGRLEGESKWFYWNDNLYALQRYQKGVPHGKQEYYTPNGKPKTVVEYDQGIFVRATVN